MRNTPISEAAICGVAIGAAQSGLRPVVEIMFVDFVTLALDQLVNQAAKAHFMSGGQLTVPLVLRTQGGAGQRGGAQHSQSLEAWLTHVPGLKVVMPSTAADAAGLLASAIADPNPVVFVENKTLYFRREERSGARRSGSDRPRAGRRAGPRRHRRRALASRPGGARRRRGARGEGIEVEVIDPRTLVPLDLEAIVESVTRTHRLVVAHEAVAHGGFGAEIAAQVQAAAFDELDAPIARVGAPFAPVPFSPPLEDAYLPGRGDVAAPCGRCSAADGRDERSIVSLLLNARSGDDRLARHEHPREPRAAEGGSALPPRRRATYVENLPLEGALSVTFVRSLLAHARIDRSRHVGRRGAAGRAGLHRRRRRPAAVRARRRSRCSTSGMGRPLVAKDVVRFVGDIVAVVVSEDRATGADAAELVMVDYDPLPVVVDPEDAAKDEVLLFPEAGTNVAAPRRPPDHDEKLFDGCDVVVSGTLVSQRMAPCPLEPRSAAAEVGADGRLTAWLSTQTPHQDRCGARRACSGSSPTQVRVIAPDVGGGFGAKIARAPRSCSSSGSRASSAGPCAGRRRAARA